MPQSFTKMFHLKMITIPLQKEAVSSPGVKRHIQSPCVNRHTSLSKRRLFVTFLTLQWHLHRLHVPTDSSSPLDLALLHGVIPTNKSSLIASSSFLIVFSCFQTSGTGGSRTFRELSSPHR